MSRRFSTEWLAKSWDPIRPWAALGPVVLVCLVALWEIVATARAGSDVPSDEHWRAASEFLRENHEPDSLLVVAPAWADPTLRLHLGDLMSIEMAARMDAARYPTLWEFSFRGHSAREVGGLSADLVRSFGPLTVRRYRQETPALVSDFLTLRPAVTGSGQRPQVRLEEVGFEIHRCMRAIPAPGQTMTLSFEAALGNRLVGYVGLADIFTRRDIREPGRMVVRVGGDEVAAKTVGIDDGWIRFEAETAPTASGVVEVDLVSPSATAKDRRLCFAMEARQQ